MLDMRIRTFLTVCETMHYTRAAEQLCITQPAVTQHIRYLEEFYGCKLFRYQGRVLSLTKEGEKLREWARSLSYNSQKIQEALSCCSTGISLRVGATKTIGEYVAAPLVRAFLRRYPQAQFSFVIENTQSLLRALEEGELDFAWIEGFFNKEKYRHQLYAKEEFFGICAPGHHLAGKTVSIADLLSETVFVREPGSGTRAILEDLLGEQNYTLQSFSHLVQISDFSVTKTLVQDGLGISFVYAPVAKKELEEGSLARIDWEQGHVWREFNFVFLRDNLFVEEWKEWIQPG